MLRKSKPVAVVGGEVSREAVRKEAARRLSSASRKKRVLNRYKDTGKSGFRFNPKVRLDPSQVEDWRNVKYTPKYRTGGPRGG
jgi:hypothetical protein